MVSLFLKVLVFVSGLETGSWSFQRDGQLVDRAHLGGLGTPAYWSEGHSEVLSGPRQFGLCLDPSEDLLRLCGTGRHSTLGGRLRTPLDRSAKSAALRHSSGYQLRHPRQQGVVTERGCR